jgi:hypothetical protein
MIVTPTKTLGLLETLDGALELEMEGVVLKKE